jgi:ribosomal protein L22
VNLCSFLLAINGLYNINLTISDQEEKNVLIISSIEGKKIQKHFELLYRNKLFSDTAFRELKTLSSQENSFTPQINPDSNILAERYRNKMIEKVNDIFSKNKIKIAVSEKGLSHEDLLVIHNIGQNLEKEKMRENKLVEIDPECTFQPNFSKSTLEQRNPNLGK